VEEDEKEIEWFLEKHSTSILTPTPFAGPDCRRL